VPPLVYVGTAPGPRSKGIQVFKLQTEDLEVSQNITLAPLGQAAASAGSGFFEIDPKRRFLFTVDEKTRQVASFAVDGSTGKLAPVSQRPSSGAAPCHLAVDKDGQWLVVANRDGVAVLPIGADGKLGAASESVSLAGSGKAARAQGVAIEAGGRLVLVCDGGQDRVLAYRFDAKKGKLTAAANLGCKPGSGPRRAVFRPDGRFAYLVSAVSTVTVLSCDPGSGTLKEIQSASTVPEYYDGPNEASEIALHPSGKFLYVSNRGHNSVVLFSVDESAGTVSFVEEQGTGGKNPTHFGVAPGAKHLAIGNQDSDTVLVCRIDAGNGRLKPSGVFTTVPTPTCVRFL
jgi:6-phosphogluconolactonase